ncbi:MAG: GNAT family N-acetyltransferase [Victivallales bacterium]|nr:GNAT family N-acetyltransferase [Victivallales bacterium]
MSGTMDRADNDVQVVQMEEADRPAFIAMAQEAFQKGFEEHFGKSEETILPEEDVIQSLTGKGAVAYKVLLDGKMVSGAIVAIDGQTQHNHLDILFVKCGLQGKGVGKAIWMAIEKRHPQTRVWETCTPYFDRRNIHFYVNVCGFQVNEFFHARHPMPDTPDDFIGDGQRGMFGFVKRMPTPAVRLTTLAEEFSVCKVTDYGRIDLSQPFVFTGSTDDEKSLVCPVGLVPENTVAREDGWRALRIEGTLDFSLIGILAGISQRLADNGIGIFAVSTFNTDYILTMTENFARAIQALKAAGYEISLHGKA